MASDSESSSETVTSIRISKQQLRKLEVLFMECKHPDKKLREKWSRELGMDPDEIKYWLKNKIFNLKIEKEREENDALRLENERIHFENIQMSNKLKNPRNTCLRNQVLENLIRENAELREKHQKMTNFVRSMGNRAVCQKVEEIKGPQVDVELRLAPPCLNNGEIRGAQIDLELKLAPSW